MFVTERILLRLVLGIVCMLGTASLSTVAAQESGERRVERRNDRDRDADRDRGPDRNREVKRDREQRRLKLDFVLSDDGDGREMVERLVRELRERFAGSDRRIREQRRPARRVPQTRDGEHDEQAARLHHLAVAIEHVQAAGLHDLAEELRGHLHQPRPRRAPRSARRHEEGPSGPRAEGDERIRNLTNMVEEIHGTLRGLHEQMGNMATIGRAPDEAHRGLDEFRHHLEQRMHEFERAVHDVSEGVNRHVENLERSINERFEQMERNVAERFEEIEHVLTELDERLEDEDDDD
jgi:hypothetical protein